MRNRNLSASLFLMCVIFSAGCDATGAFGPTAVNDSLAGTTWVGQFEDSGGLGEATLMVIFDPSKSSRLGIWQMTFPAGPTPSISGSVNIYNNEGPAETVKLKLQWPGVLSDESLYFEGAIRGELMSGHLCGWGDIYVGNACDATGIRVTLERR